MTACQLITLAAPKCTNTRSEVTSPRPHLRRLLSLFRHQPPRFNSFIFHTPVYAVSLHLPHPSLHLTTVYVVSVYFYTSSPRKSYSSHSTAVWDPQILR